ncbi:hypothetical protein IDSA_04825 [Pseudidiomarina salinarum]|uniref:Uncharacterized protein n=1 Tax=Pseudidiomarina salinarum TaxID=435908 RepID=A0A094LAV5_9GAMM|nr:hypothetical protein [Pseudidiomarina salinarum]KFZ32003.1 hypothetical protein IDSA_04825 [Pseudidiomarina salinarum]RUO70220.1 hypothetical protein CWI79_01755 [Pseudidiomarina salinarum]
MSSDMIPPVTGRHLAMLVQKRDEHSTYGRYAKIALGIVILIGVTGMLTMKGMRANIGSFSDWYWAILLARFAAELFILASVSAVLCILWERHKVEQLEFIDEEKLEPQQYELLEHPNYRALRDVQGGVYNFQFQKLKLKKLFS